MKAGNKIFKRNFSICEKAIAYLVMGLFPIYTMPEMALALPHGGSVSKGTASLTYSTNNLTVKQNTTSATFNWSSFNLKSGQSVVYKTPGSSSVSLNYISSSTPSTINGTISSNGVLEFMNPNGLIFGSGSVISAAGVMAFASSTPWGTSNSYVSNAGTIQTTNSGTVVLAGQNVTNTGTIESPGGNIVLASGTTITPIYSNNNTSLSVATTGGGTVTDSGYISAPTVGNKTGNIILQSGMNSGTTTLETAAVLEASSVGTTNGNGGDITVNGYKVVLAQVSPLNVSSESAKSGEITIDPTCTIVSTAAGLEGIDQSQSSYLNNSGVYINIAANINMESGGVPYNWTPLGNSSATSFNGTINGNNHTISGYTITAINCYTTTNYRTIGVGLVGYVGTSGVIENLGVAGSINSIGSWNVGGLVGINNGTLSNVWNAGSITTSNTSNSGNNVGGVVGENCGNIYNAWNSGTIYASGGSATGGIVGGSCSSKNIISDSWNSGTINGGIYTGGIVGIGSATIKYSYNSGSINGQACVGGIVGYNFGNISNSFNTGTILATGKNVGGIVGSNNAIINNTYNTGKIEAQNISYNVGGIAGVNCSGSTVENSYNTANVSGGYYVGGVVGQNYASNIINSYNTGNVSGSNSIGEIGGVVGFNWECGSVSQTYNLGSVTGSSSVGGILGKNGDTWVCNGYTNNSPGDLSNSYYNTTTFSGPAVGTIVSGSGSTSNNVYGISQSAFSSISNVSYLGTFNTWGTSGFTASGTTAPWFEGQVTFGNSTITAPMLVPDMPIQTITANSGSSVYNGSTATTGYTSTYTMGGTTSLIGTIATNTSGANVASYSVTPVVSAMQAPTTQLSPCGSISVSGTWNITPLAVTATATQTSMIAQTPIPSLTGNLSGANSGINNLSATWTTPATSASLPGNYSINPTFSYANGAISQDFTILDSSINATALTINPIPQVVSSPITVSSSPTTTVTAGPVTTVGTVSLSQSSNLSLTEVQPQVLNGANEYESTEILSVEETN